MTSNAQYFRNIWIVILFLVLWSALSFARGYFVEKIRQKRENYTDLHKRVLELERKIK